MSEDSPELSEARLAIDLAIKNFLSIHQKEREKTEPYVMAWALHTEFINGDLVQEGHNTTQSIFIAPDDQLISTSIGLLHLGMRYFNIERVV